MIHYQLRCSEDHSFDGWFRDSGAFDRQAAAGLVACPVCGGTRVNRALMAPRIGKRGGVVDAAGREEGAGREAGGEPVPAPAPEPAVKGGVAMPDQVRGLLQKLRAEVERSCENVGERFAEEARAIHQGETPARAIYGDATPEQAEALAEEGVPIARIPWVPRADG